MRAISIWALPFASLLLVPITLFIALGASVPIVTIGTLLVGTLFVVMGNYLPKTRQNYVMGIKLPWTFSDTENWNKTNRLAGYVMMAGGMVVLIGGFIPFLGNATGVSLIGITTFLILAIPFAYSYGLYKKEQNKNFG